MVAVVIFKYVCLLSMCFCCQQRAVIVRMSLSICLQCVVVVYKLSLLLKMFVVYKVVPSLIAAAAPPLHKVNQCQGKPRFINQMFTFNEAKINYCRNKDEPTVNQRKVREKEIRRSCSILRKLYVQLVSLFAWKVAEKRRQLIKHIAQCCEQK